LGSGQEDEDDDMGGMFDYQQEVGDQFCAVKPWTGAIRPPDDAPKKYNPSRF